MSRQASCGDCPRRNLQGQEPWLQGTDSQALACCHFAALHSRGFQSKLL